ncbi:MAG: PhoH family protein [Blastocatellia bacterium]
MRGRTLSDAFIILDEAQNTTSRTNEDVLLLHWLRLESCDHGRCDTD